MAFQLERMDGKNVLITGGLGFIGSNLAVHCISLGANGTLFERTASKMCNISDIKDKVQIVNGDISNLQDVEKIISGKDIIFHLAAQTSNITSMENPFLDISLNIIGTMNLLESCRKNNPSAKIVFTGTCTQVGKTKKLPFEESLKDDPIDIYATNKLACESYMKIYSEVYGMNTTTIRFGNIFGERQQLNSTRFGITNYFIGRALKGEPITVYGDGKFIRDYNYINNVTDALILAAQNPKSKGEVFLIGSDKMYFIDMVKQLADAMKEKTEKEVKITYVEYPAHQKKIDAGDIEVDYGKIKRILGWEPQINFTEGIKRTINYYLKDDKYKEYL
ncbi:MAG: GDP-mannose 4,6-dehydratase [archaeon]|nr:GDP-mannose 4,6-dehydratase [archaeon]